MPWTVVDGEETYTFPAELRIPPGASEDTEEGNALMAAWVARTPFFVQHWLVDFYQFHKYCPRKACRREGACRSARFVCYDEAEPWLRENVYPEIRRLIRDDENPANAAKETDDYPPEVYAAAKRRRAEDAARERRRGRGRGAETDRDRHADSANDR